MEPIPKMRYKKGDLKVSGWSRTYLVLVLILVVIAVSVAVGIIAGYSWSYRVNSVPLIEEISRLKEKNKELRQELKKGYFPQPPTPQPKKKGG